LPQTLEKLL
jgi:hypothetical protein